MEIISQLEIIMQVLYYNQTSQEILKIEWLI